MINYQTTEPEQNTFKTVSIQTTYKCQLSCSNCYLGNMLNNSSIPDIDVDRFRDFLSRLNKRTDIRFIGAEPTMNPNLFEMIKMTRTYGHRPSLLTNGLKLRREDYTKALKVSGLNMLGISMNGGLDENMYKEFDNGKYAKSKTIALSNCFKYNIMPHINVIMDPTNKHVIAPLIDYIVSSATAHGRAFSTVKYPVALRVKSIGQMGFYRKTHTYTLEEMIDIMSDIHKFDIRKTITNTVDGYEEKRSVLYKFETSNGPMLGKLTDWSVDDDGVPDSGSSRRGILTDDYKIAPFFEYYSNTQESITNV
jgi:uncharacterized radical SAM superfamily Fe-S cluster-containing enzyme